MTTGRLAAETVIETERRGQGQSDANLAEYRKKLDESFVIKDLKKYKEMPDIFHSNRQFFTTYPELVNRSAHNMLHVDGVDKKTKEREIFSSFMQKRSLFGLMGDAYNLWRAFR